MGYGSYSAQDWEKLKKSMQLEPDKNVEEIFKRKECNPKFDPKYINTRECFDSDDHPKSTPIVVGLDVTGSMGYLAVEVATKALNALITKLYSTNIIEDPALMCAAYGDYRDSSPLQVTQFESDIRIAEQLLELYFEDKGNGKVVPTCLWEFLSRHTNIDAINKRGEKGYVFTIGDVADIREDEVQSTIERVIGDSIPGITVESILKEVEQKFNVFHIMIGSGENPNAFLIQNGGNTNILMGHKINIPRADINIIPEIIIGTIQLQKGESLDEVIEKQDEIIRPSLKTALKQLQIFDADRPVNL